MRETPVVHFHRQCDLFEDRYGKHEVWRKGTKMLVGFDFSTDPLQYTPRHELRPMFVLTEKAEKLVTYNPVRRCFQRTRGAEKI